MNKTSLESHFKAVKTAFATGELEHIPEHISVNVLNDSHAADVYNEYDSFEEVLKQVKKLAVHNKLEAVKLIKRTWLVGGLKDSKDFVDFQMYELGE